MTALRRSLGLPSLAFYGTGLILGAGIYSVLGAAAAKAGEALWLSFVLGSAVALLTGMSYAELATMYPRAGAEHVYLSEAFPARPMPAFLAGSVLLLSGCGTAATVALAFGGYLRDLVAAPVVPVAVLVLAALTVVNLVGVRESTWVSAAFTLVEAGGLVLVIVLAVSTGRFGQALGSPVTLGVLPGAALLFFAYLGFEEIVNLAEETKDPGRTLPRAIFVSVAVTTVLYVLVALAAVALVPAATLAGSDGPLAAAAASVSSSAAKSLGVIALFATANTCLATLVGVSRMAHGMARSGALPGALSSVLRGRRTPWVAALATLGVSALLCLPGDVPWIAGLSSFGALVAFAAVNGCVIVLRRRHPRVKRPFAVPLAIRGVPLPALLGVILSLLLASQFESATLLSGGAALLVAGAAWALRRAWGGRR